MKVGPRGKQYNPCAAFEFDKKNNDCSLYNSIPNNIDDRLTFHWMEKTYNKLWRNK